MALQTAHASRVGDQDGASRVDLQPRRALSWQILVLAAVLFWGVTAGCQPPHVDPPNVQDSDGDGYTALNGDCNDRDGTVYPHADESCNLVDDNCNGLTDEDVEVDYYLDDDQDGYGSKTAPTKGGCNPPPRHVANDSDCNDDDAYINPKAVEICDEIDNNCDGIVDSDAVNRIIFYRDFDGDTFGNAAQPAKGCAVEKGYADNSDDCDDYDADVNPDMEEKCDYIDNDCDTQIDEGWDLDDDGTPDCQGIEVCDGVDNNGDGTIDEGYDKDQDGYTPLSCDCRSVQQGGTSTCGLDCNDMDPNINPKADEICDINNVDEDCDFVADNDDPSAAMNGKVRFYVDADEDGFGDDNDEGRLECDNPSDGTTQYVINPDDCDDADPDRNPAVQEACDFKDNDCDQVVDEDWVYIQFYEDKDGDGFGSDPFYELRCKAPAGYVNNPDDCDDTNKYIYPGSYEVCDDKLTDEDCDGTADDEDEDSQVEVPDGVPGESKQLYYADGDGDTFGNREDPGAYKCHDPSSPDGKFVLNNQDCDDADKTVYYNAPELCDYRDNDCDGLVDNNVEYYLFIPDVDQDGFGDFEEPGYLSCTYPEDRSTVLLEIETVDEDGDGKPDAIEYVFDFADNDCDDSQPDVPVNEINCTKSPPEGKSFGGHCIYPRASERCNLVDDDCDGVIDEPDAIDAVVWYKDVDNDGFGDPNSTTTSCGQDPPEGYPGTLAPTGYTNVAGDCDDEDPAISPAASEICKDHTDNDCDGKVDEDSAVDAHTWYADTDGDTFGNPAVSVPACYQPSGYVSDKTDCNDGKALVNPAAEELCNGVDDDCDGVTDELSSEDASTWWQDFDKDGYGSEVVYKVQCYKPDGYVSDHTDCDDTDPGANPGSEEVCDENNVDEDCSGTADDDDGGLPADHSSRTGFWPDHDKDGYGDKNASSVLLCDDPSSSTLKYSTNPQDCNDSDATINPAATEIAGDNVDQNCDTTEICYLDNDDDTYRPNATATITSSNTVCTDSKEAVSSDPIDDCNDNDATVRPNATESPADGVDQNCDTKELCYRDSDDDGYRPSSSATVVSGDLDCLDPTEAEASDPTGDCNDANGAINPGATEVTGDNVDQNCDNVEMCYKDSDNDGYRPNATATVLSTDKDCNDSTEALATEPTGDCNDDDATIKPSATEGVADGVDQNCDNNELCYKDADNDGYRPDSTSTVYSTDLDCVDEAEAAGNEPTGDCNDENSNIKPAATEIAGDNIDQNCDGTELCYKDSDDDGYRPDLTSTVTSTDTDCNDSAEAVASDPAGDCDDANSSANPGKTEITANGVDNDCDGTEICYQDADDDGYRPDATSILYSDDADCTDPGEAISTMPTNDCDDRVASVHPTATELCNQVDDDCNGTVDDGATDVIYYRDKDGDGYGTSSTTTSTCEAAPTGYVAIAGDCNDNDAAINPEVDEVCNSKDDDCNGQTDENVKTTYYRDSDGDGYGDKSLTTPACSAPSGYVADNTDCKDSDGSIHPGAAEACNGIDDDCDSDADEGVKETFYLDTDGDTFGDPDSSGEACDAPAGYVSDAQDCDDSDGEINPDATELPGDEVDQDCDDEELCYQDADNDGYRPDSGATITSTDIDCTDAHEALSSDPATDCDDTNANINPGEDEVVNGIDDDCNGSVDDGVGDFDGDGYSEAAGDCDDGNDEVFPGATEVCNEIDDDCDNHVDEGVLSTFYIDVDEDGYGASSVTEEACSAPSGYVANDDDCDDRRDTVHVGATEVCNDTDDDCDGNVDEGVLITYYRDNDDDGYGDAAHTDEACSQPDGYVANDDDCNDTGSGADINPDAAEVIGDNTDQDCDGHEYCYRDADNDGYLPDSGTTTIISMDEDCNDAYEGTDSDPQTDCDDTDADVNPGEDELCNAVDDDCNGTVDDGAQSTYYEDGDGDGYGLSSSSITACTKPAGYATSGGDCDDENAAVNPGATEICDGSDVDEDCNGTADDDDAGTASSGKTRYYPDSDEDDYGDETNSGTLYCDDPSDGFSVWVTENTDCDDTDEFINPLGSEVCDADNDDEDCNGLADDDDPGTAPGGKTRYYPDADEDDYGDETDSGTLYCDDPSGASVWVTDNTDCDESSELVNPGVSETTCDGVDNDCDPATDDAPDVDSDTYDICNPGDAGDTDTFDADCNDDDGTINPGASETTCDGIDNDCDAATEDAPDNDSDGYDVCNPSDDGDTDTFDADCDDSCYSCREGGSETADGNGGSGAGDVAGYDDDCDGLVDEDDVAAGDLVITEIMVEPNGTGIQWFEVYNDAGTTLYLDGWTLTLDDGTDVNEFCVSPDAAVDIGSDSSHPDLADGAYLVFCANDASFCDYVFGADNSYGDHQDSGGNTCAAYDTTWAFGIHSAAGTADDLNISIDDPDAAAVEVDDVAYDESWPHDTAGFSMQFDNGAVDATSNDTSSNWCTPSVNAAAFTDGGTQYGTPGAVNETCDTIGWCNLQHPYSLTTTVNVATDPVYGRVYVAGVTDGEGQGAGITAKLGYGPLGSSPAGNSDWSWVSASYNVSAGDNDEYMTTLTVSTAGTYAYAYRFSRDGGTTWVYCDKDGSGTADAYDTGSQVTLTVSE